MKGVFSTHSDSVQANKSKKNIMYKKTKGWIFTLRKISWDFREIIFGPDDLKKVSKRRKWPARFHTAHSKVLLLRAYLKVTFHETMAFSFILGSNRPNQMPRGISENFCTPRGAWGRGEHRVPNLGSLSANYRCYLLNTTLTTIMHDSIVS